MRIKKKKIKTPTKKPDRPTTVNRAKKPRYVIEKPRPKATHKPDPTSKAQRQKAHVKAIRERKDKYLKGSTIREVKSLLDPSMSLDDRRIQYRKQIYMPQLRERLQKLFYLNWKDFKYNDVEIDYQTWEDLIVQRIENLGIDSEELKKVLSDSGLTEVYYDSGDFVDFNIDTIEAEGPSGIFKKFMNI